MSPALEKLERPPIVEAICGIHFERHPAIDSVLMGAYWHTSRRARFPVHKLKPPLIDEPGPFMFVNDDANRSRVWLCNATETRTIQIQDDRFYLNWRLGEGVYPRFSEQQSGLRDETLAEFEHLCAWLSEGGLPRPRARKVELTKLDHFPWKSRDDLLALLPSLAQVVNLSVGSEPDFLVRIGGNVDAGTPQVTIVTALLEDGARVIRLETTAQRSVTADGGEALRAAFDSANLAVNDVFCRLIPDDERARRFGRQR